MEKINIILLILIFILFIYFLQKNNKKVILIKDTSKYSLEDDSYNTDDDKNIMIDDSFMYKMAMENYPYNDGYLQFNDYYKRFIDSYHYKNNFNNNNKLEYKKIMPIPIPIFPPTFSRIEPENHLLGILIANNPELDQQNKIIKLYGHQKFNRNFYYYIVMNTQNDVIKIELDKNKYYKELYNDDIIIVPELNNMSYKVKLYN